MNTNKKNGFTVGGHNLQYIEFYKDSIKMYGIDIINENYDIIKEYWQIKLDMNKIEYLKIEPTVEKEEIVMNKEYCLKKEIKQLKKQNLELEKRIRALELLTFRDNLILKNNTHMINFICSVLDDIKRR